ncbi:hypothetical protein PHLCEN_2v6404 [Hermanssonia centrifuga]|uniref:Uncharacterized protein n=1 Tax=Hermanssonia centrifuga TaxID=98765 RepID=A0A2R6NZJ7_9APHY|nr:hypothetical protein PHLCEN_2v6404 [Hermanssonia centrifuga]
MEIMRTRVCQPFRRIQARQIQSRPTLHHDHLAFFDSFPHFQQRNHPLSNIPTGEAAAGRLVLSALLKPAYLATSTGSDTDPEKEIHPQEPGEISDQEWEIRTVRPEAESKPSNGTWSLTNALGLKTKGKEKAKEEQTESESIYSPRIRLTNYTYTFSPITGHILHHNVDSIEPAPTQALFEALGKLGLFGSGSSGAGNAGPGIGR